MLMNRLWGGVSAALMAVAGTGAVLSACASDDSTIFVYDVLAPQVVSAGTPCSFTSDPTQPQILGGGVLDVDLRGEYDPTYLVGNQLVAQANPTAARTETSFVTLQKATVIVKNDQQVTVDQFEDLVSTTIAPASGGTPSYGPITVTTIDNATAIDQGPPPGDHTDQVRLLTYVQFFGQTLGGDSVQSDVYQFPVILCRGCLVTIAAADISPLYQSPNCVGSGQMAATSGPCAIGQDLSVDCSLCQSISSDCSPPAIPIADAGTTTATTSTSTSTSTSTDAGTD
jgi:hypothetical protein